MNKYALLIIIIIIYKYNIYIDTLQWTRYIHDKTCLNRDSNVLMVKNVYCDIYGKICNNILNSAFNHLCNINKILLIQQHIILSYFITTELRYVYIYILYIIYICIFII